MREVRTRLVQTSQCLLMPSVPCETRSIRLEPLPVREVTGSLKEYSYLQGTGFPAHAIKITDSSQVVEDFVDANDAKS